MNNGMNTGYLCFLIVAKYLNVKVPKSSAEGFSENAETEIELLRLGKQLGMKVKVGKLSVKKMQKTVVPLIAETKENEYIIILTYKDDNWTILDPVKGVPEVVSNDDLLKLISGRILAFGKKNSSSYESNHKFGFRWFILTIIKFKKQFICVLIAVFVVQIIGILTPLMTQVVVDKVLSHHALSTLHTIAIGILIAYIYELMISLAKSYLFVHTTN